MAQENLAAKFAALTNKQKIMSVAIIIVMIILIWQLMGLFRGGASAPKSQAITPVKPSTMQMSPAAPGSPEAAATPQIIQNQAVPPPVSPRDSELMRLQQETQAKYISTLNELQMLKLERDIAETNQAIAAAKLATVTAEKNISDLLTRPAAQVSAGAYANQLVSPVSSGQGPVPQQPQVQMQMPPAPIEQTAYVVISVSMQLQKWSAVLGYQGKLYNVSVGDVLPPDGSIVAAIDKEGVVLRKNGNEKRVSIVTSI